MTIDKLSKKADWTENCELKRGSIICVVESRIYRQVKRKRKLLQSPLKSILKENLLEGIAETRECQRKPNGLGSVQTRKGKLIAVLIFSLLMGLQTSFEFPSFYRSLHTHTHTDTSLYPHMRFRLCHRKKFFPPILFASFRCHCCWSLKICVRK